MKTPSSTKRILGALIFAVGVLSSTLLTGALTWAGLEATLYGFERYTPNHFDGLSCPPLMTRAESGLIHVAVNNPTDMQFGSVNVPTEYPVGTKTYSAVGTYTAALDGSDGMAMPYNTTTTVTITPRQ